MQERKKTKRWKVLAYGFFGLASAWFWMTALGGAILLFIPALLLGLCSGRLFRSMVKDTETWGWWCEKPQDKSIKREVI